MTLREITWCAMPRTPHGALGCITTRWGVLRIAAVINERINPARPAGAAFCHPKPYTLELYLPLPIGTDRVQKFATEEEARQKAATMLAKFVASVAGVG